MRGISALTISSTTIGFGTKTNTTLGLFLLIMVLIQTPLMPFSAVALGTTTLRRVFRGLKKEPLFVFRCLLPLLI